MVPVTSYFAPSPFAKPSPPTVTVLFVSALPSYGLLADALVSVTDLLEIFSLPSTITNVTLLNCSFLFRKSDAFKFISYVPALVPFTSFAVSAPTNSKSFSVYSVLLMLVTV